MTRVYIADALKQERSALRLLLLDLKMEVAGEAGDWLSTLANAPATHPDMLLVDWALLPAYSGADAIKKMRGLCLSTIIIVLLSHADVNQQAALFAGANAFISKNELPEHVAQRLTWAAAYVPTAPFS